MELVPFNSVEEILEYRHAEFDTILDDLADTRKKALSKLDKETLNTVETLLNLRDHGEDDAIKGANARYLAKLHGLEVEKFAGTIDFIPFKISRGPEDA